MDSIDNNIIYCFWTGINPITEKRLHCLEKLEIDTDCTIRLIRAEDLPSYILKEHPLHEAYTYLSETHKADYLRTYFMHFYGGGYTDIKLPTGSWLGAFEEMRSSPTSLLNGYQERGISWIANPAVKDFWQKLPGNSAYIVRPQTVLTSEWYSSMMSLLDTKLEDLKRNPSTCPRCNKEEYGLYPIEWNEMLGRIFHLVCSRYMDRIILSVPPPNADLGTYL